VLHKSDDRKFWSLENANLYTKPDSTPPIHVAGSGSTSARIAGGLGDGFLTVHQEPERVEKELFPAIEHGVDKSESNNSPDDLTRTILIHCSYVGTEAAALKSCKP
jgi:alkanesulfonate monooxygenase SsuD/methylene tetrahydromethanopterin reductase-like flavin-dependent oxidoreductase (luciferase family)